jgi:DNA-binding transcriptional ArsR family regulator
MMTASVQIVQGTESAAALLNPLRLRILEQLPEDGSAASIARQLGIPRQHVNYHLRELEHAGLVEFVEERRKGNCMERIMRAAARSYLIGPQAIGALGTTPEMVADHFSMAYLVSLGARIIRDLTALAERAVSSGKRISTLGMETEIRFASSAERSAFAAELTASVARLTAKYHNAGAPGGRTFRLVLGVFPSITKTTDAPAVNSVRME